MKFILIYINEIFTMKENYYGLSFSLSLSPPSKHPPSSPLLLLSFYNKD